MENAYQRYKERLGEIFVKYADENAMVCLRENGEKAYLTFAELSKKIRQWAEKLLACSIAAGDRVAILAPLMPYTVTAGLTLAYANVTAVLLDPSLPAEEISRLLEYSDVQGIFTTKNLFQKLGIKSIPVFDLENSDDELMQFTMTPSSNRKTSEIKRDTDTIAIIYSSGTTSSMKGVMYTFESVLQSWKKLSFSFGLVSELQYFMVLPYNHISGYISATAFLLSGDTLCMAENLIPAKLQSSLLDFNPHYFAMIPKVYDIMADKIRDAIHQKGFLAEVIVGAGIQLSEYLRKTFGLKIGKVLLKPIYSKVLGKNITGLAILGTICKPETARLFLAFGLEWANLYATTETNAPITTTGIFDRYPLNSVGKVDRFDDIDIVINAPNAEGIGEVYVKTPLIMKGYFREPELTSAAFDSGYFKTGDLGYVNQDGYLYLVGRSKDTIVLHSGKKVSAADIDEFYQSVCPGINIAVCGVSEPDGFDAIHLFIETHGHSQTAIQTARTQIFQRSAAAGSIYRVAAVHEIECLPVTSIGKVKRFLLQEEVKDTVPAQSLEQISVANTENVSCVIRKLAASATKRKCSISPDLRLQEDLGLDSIDVFEICVELEEKFSVSVAPYLHEGITVGELEELINQGRAEKVQEDSISDQYPLKKSEKDIDVGRAFMTISKVLWKIKASGQEKLCLAEKYIFCPNHESYLDGMWIAGCLGEQSRQDMCSLAAAHLFESKFFRRGLILLGGIPVHRNGNTAPAMKRAYECLTSRQYHLLIHPEGTRSRSGELGEFKQGAAKLAIETGTKIIPVCINGAYEIFPPHRKLPRLFDWKHLRRYPLQIYFGQPINPEGKTPDEITGEIKEQITVMKREQLL